jgi:hypothetical protein
MKSGTQETLARYVAAQSSSGGTRSLAAHPGRRFGYRPVMQSVELCGGNTLAKDVIRMGSPLSIVVTYSHDRPVRPLLGVAVKTIYGAPVFCVSDRYCEHLADSAPWRSGRVICTIDDLRLMPGTYSIDLYLGEAAEDFDIVFEAISFEVVAADLNGTGRLPHSSLGPIFCSARFQLMPEERDLTSPAGSPYNGSGNNARPEDGRSAEAELPPSEDTSN